MIAVGTLVQRDVVTSPLTREQCLRDAIPATFPRLIIEIIQEYARESLAIIFIALDTLLTPREEVSDPQQPLSQAMTALSLAEPIDPQALGYLHALIRTAGAIYNVGIVIIMSHEKEKTIETLKKQLFTDQVAGEHIIGILIRDDNSPSDLPPSRNMVRSSPIADWLRDNSQHKMHQLVGIHQDEWLLRQDSLVFPCHVVRCDDLLTEAVVEAASRIVTESAFSPYVPNLFLHHSLVQDDGVALKELLSVIRSKQILNSDQAAIVSYFCNHVIELAQGPNLVETSGDLTIIIEAVLDLLAIPPYEVEGENHFSLIVRFFKKTISMSRSSPNSEFGALLWKLSSCIHDMAFHSAKTLLTDRKLIQENPQFASSISQCALYTLIFSIDHSEIPYERKKEVSELVKMHAPKNESSLYLGLIARLKHASLKCKAEAISAVKK